MNIFTINDISNRIISHCDPIDDFFKIRLINKYCEKLINCDYLFNELKKLLSYNKKHKLRKTSRKTSHDNNLFINACKMNSPLCEYLLKKYPNIDIRTNYEELFMWSCKAGNIDIIHLLINMSKHESPDEPVLHDKINKKLKEAFQLCCKNGHLDIAKLLIKLSEQTNFTKFNIHSDQECAFRDACMKTHIHVIKWLCTLSDKYFVRLNDDGMTIDFQKTSFMSIDYSRYAYYGYIYKLE